MKQANGHNDHEPQRVEHAAHEGMKLDAMGTEAAQQRERERGVEPKRPGSAVTRWAPVLPLGAGEGGGGLPPTQRRSASRAGLGRQGAV